MYSDSLMKQPILKIEDLSFSYLSHHVLDKISFNLEKGEVGTFIGGSGSGKTTLFKLLTGILTPSAGTISIAGHETQLAHHHVACMMQEDLLLPWRSIIRNVTLLSELGIDPHSSVIEEAYELLEEIGLSGCEELFPNQLSGGMRQRVSLARALLQKRPLLLLDEPFGSLDVSLREQMYVLLRKLQHKHNTTILMVTHDFRDALTLSDRIFLLGNGKIRAEWKVTDEIRNDPLSSGEMLNDMRSKLMGIEKETLTLSHPRASF